MMKSLTLSRTIFLSSSTPLSIFIVILFFSQYCFISILLRSYINLNREPLTSLFSNFRTNLWCDTLSKAFLSLNKHSQPNHLLLVLCVACFSRCSTHLLLIHLRNSLHTIVVIRVICTWVGLLSFIFKIGVLYEYWPSSLI